MDHDSSRQSGAFGLGPTSSGYLVALVEAGEAGAVEHARVLVDRQCSHGPMIEDGTGRVAGSTAAGAERGHVGLRFDRLRSKCTTVVARADPPDLWRRARRSDGSSP